MQSSVELLQCRPPDAQDPLFAYRNAVLDMCLTDSLRDRRRRFLLETCLCGDWRSEGIKWYTEDPNPDIQTWARQVSWALLLAAVEDLQRHRWLTKLGGVRDGALMSSCHGILVINVFGLHDLLLWLEHADYLLVTHVLTKCSHPPRRGQTKTTNKSGT